MNFAFKDLIVWQKSVDFADAVITLTENLNTPQQHYRLKEQVEAACTSVPCNIAEGKGRNSRKEFLQYLYIARGSLYETITLMILFQKRNWISQQDLNQIETMAQEILAMLQGLIHNLREAR
jgi:four helix bundle protein